MINDKTQTVCARPISLSLFLSLDDDEDDEMNEKAGIRSRNHKDGDLGDWEG